MDQPMIVAATRAELDERLGARRDPDPVGGADEVAAPPAVDLEAKQSADLGLIAIWLDDERLADVLSHSEASCRHSVQRI
jgi:hypothetical protein